VVEAALHLPGVQDQPSTRAMKFGRHKASTNISELLRSVDKPPLAELPFFVGC